MDFLFKELIFFLSLSFCFHSYSLSVLSLSTVSISETSNQTLICALIPSSNEQSFLECSTFPARGIPISPSSTNVSYSAVVGGNGFLCALTPSFSSPSTSIMVCSRFSADANPTTILYKRIYLGPTITEIASGNSHICGVVNRTNKLECWQWRRFNTNTSQIVSNIAVGEDFVCGLSELRQIQCFGSNNVVIDNVPVGNYTTVAAGFRHACALSTNGSLECWGNMIGEKPVDEFFTTLALGENRSCGLRINQTVICWGENNFGLPESLWETFFVDIKAKRNIFCGILTSNFSLYCWGNENFDSNPLVFNEVVPGPCRSECPCRSLPSHGQFCRQGLMICEPCTGEQTPGGSSPASPPQGLPTCSGCWTRNMVAFLVVGCVGSLSFIIVVIILFWRYCKVRGCRIHDSGRLDGPGPPGDPQTGIPSQSQPSPAALEKRLSHLISMGTGNNLEEFALDVLLQATDNFSDDHKIGTGSFGAVYQATLEDGRELALKRAEASASSSYYAGIGTKRQEDKEQAFLNELEFLSRLNHKNLVRLLGFCIGSNERVLVYEYVNNGTLHDHLHRFQSSQLISWAARIKVALDAARGIEYLHVYAVPPIIHRDIKSSNILLDATWTAKVSDFGLSLTGPSDDESHLSLRAAGTVGYMDPEYYRFQQLTTKSDVYSFGVVLLELLSGRKAIHRNENGIPRNVVDFVVPYIAQDEIHRVLDRRVPPPTPFEIEAVTYVGYIAADCVTLEGRDRPTMSEIVNSLERALIACLAPPSISCSTTGSSM